MPDALSRAQILADEEGTIRKDPGGRLRIALLYPNEYAVGMSNLGFQTLYRLLNARDDVCCERAFFDSRLPVRAGLRTLESNTPLGAMDVVAFSISYELDYPGLPRMLRQGGIEPLAAQRDGPFVVAGGATMSYNPEPVAPFLDAVLVGEAEGVLDAMVEAFQHRDRQAVNASLKAIPGIYLPARGSLPTARIALGNLDHVPAYTRVFTPHTEFGHMGLVEVGRGCPYACLFCVASHVYRPARWRSPSVLIPVIEDQLDYRRRIGLVGASVTDHPHILDLCDEILRRGGQPSPASMRADALTDELLTLLVQGGVQSITLAPEAGREPLRRRVGKRLSDEALFAAGERAARAGIRRMKLYFIVGLPEETEDDVHAIPTLALALARETGMHVSLGCSALVPKPGTPFARRAMAPERDIKRKLSAIGRELRGRAEMTHESARWSFWQAVLARGGRELAPALLAIADGKDTPGAWADAFRQLGIDPSPYALAEIPRDAPVPWAHIGSAGCLQL